jgi:hypothetical protein
MLTRETFHLSCRLTLVLLLAAVSALGAPGIDLDKMEINFGNIGQHQVMATEILISSTGDRNLEITEIYTSCPCTVLNLQQEIIPPGGVSILEVSFHSRDYEGQTDKIIEIYTNDPERPLIEVMVKAFIRTPIRFTPAGRVLDFGEHPRGDTPSLAVELKGIDISPLEISLLESHADLFTVDISGNTGGDPSRVEVAISMLTTAAAGPFREIIRLGTNAPGMETVDLEITGTLVGDLQPQPASLNFRFVKSGQDLSGEVEIVAGKPDLQFNLTGVEIDLPGLAASVSPTGKILVAGQALAKGDPLAKKTRGRLKGTLTIHTDSPTEPRILVDVLYILRK